MGKTAVLGEYSTVFVETGSNWFKIIEAEQLAKGLCVSKICLERFEDIGSGLSQSIAAAFKKHKFSNIPVISCVPRQMVNIRMLELPSMDPDEISDMVGFQAGKQTPYSKDEVAFDYKMLESDRDGYTRVLLAIVQRSVLRQRYSLLEEAGIEVARMSVSSEGVLNWYEQAAKGEQQAPGASVLVDIDSTYWLYLQGHRMARQLPDLVQQMRVLPQVRLQSDSRRDPRASTLPPTPWEPAHSLGIDGARLSHTYILQWFVAPCAIALEATKLGCRHGKCSPTLVHNSKSSRRFRFA